jgi:Resolvase, N terminal domain
MNKITADHLARRACVYIRQSTPGQVQHNLESQRRQYALVDRARSLGWQDVDVIDDDLGISGSGTRRPGFERLLRALCDGQVGAVFSIEASRLARNGRDWHTLLMHASSLMPNFRGGGFVRTGNTDARYGPLPLHRRPSRIGGAMAVTGR